MKHITPAFNVIAAFVFALGIVTSTWISIRADDATQTDTITALQAENVSLHQQLNESETKRGQLLAVIDEVDRSSYWTGRQHQCILDGYEESVCESMLDTLREQVEAGN